MGHYMFWFRQREKDVAVNGSLLQEKAKILHSCLYPDTSIKRYGNTIKVGIPLKISYATQNSASKIILETFYVMKITFTE